MRSAVSFLPFAVCLCSVQAFAVEQLSFGDVLERARARNLELRRTENAVKLARHEREALEAKDDAKLTASASGSAKYSKPVGGGTSTGRAPTAAEPGTFDEQYALQASGTLFDFGRTAAERTKADLFVAEKESLAKEQEEALVSRVSRAYAKVLSSQSLAEIAMRQIENAQQKYKQTQDNYSKGLRPEYDLARAASDLGRARVTAKRATDDLALAQLQLQLLMSDVSATAVPRGEGFPRLRGTLKKEASKWQSLVDHFTRTSDAAALKTKEIQRKGNAAELESIDAKLRPSLNASAGLSLSHTTPFPEPKESDYRSTLSGGLTLSWDIPWNLAYRDDRMRVALRDRDLDIAEQAERRTRNEKLNTAAASVNALIEQSDILEKQVELVSKTLSIVRQKYDVGKASATELSVAEDEALNARIEVARNQLATATAILDLAEASGTTNVETIFSEE